MRRSVAASTQQVTASGASRRRGTALLWTISALLALSVALTGTGGAFMQVSRLNRRSRQRLIAVRRAEQEMERVRAGAVRSAGSHDLGACKGLPDSRTLLVLSADREPRLQRVALEISWRDADGQRRMTWSTLVKK